MKYIQDIAQSIMRLSILPVLAMFMLIQPGNVLAGDLTVLVENIKSDQGNVRVALFNTANGFPKKSLGGQYFSAKSGVMFFAFKDLPKGKYAVSAFHDINGNDKLDTNFVGKPDEPYGFSNNARGTFGPPSFEDASFQIDDQPKSINISIK